MTASGHVWLGIHGAQWLSVCALLFLCALLSEAFLGHYRSGFAVRMQYSPFILGLALIGAFGAAVVTPYATWAAVALRWSGWAAIGLSLVGVAFHYYYGIVEKPGGRGWLLHHLMYHAPLLAPLALAAVGGMALIADASVNATTVLGLSPARASALVVGATLLGLMLQVSVLHYRGAFKNPVMYAPLAIALLASASAAWRFCAPTATSMKVYVVALWIVFLLGFIGWGWHLRGLDRMMGGLYVTLPNLLDGPPPIAPLLFALLAAQGIVGEKLL